MRKYMAILFLLNVNLAFSYDVNLVIDDTKSFEPSPIISSFGFISAFYERILFGFDIFYSTDKVTLQEISSDILVAYKSGKKSTFIVKNYLNGIDLRFTFSKESSYGENIICISNYDSRKKVIIDNASGSTWAFLLNNVKGYFFDRRANENTEKKANQVGYANDMLFDKNLDNDNLIEDILLSEINGKGEAFAFIVLAQYYFYTNVPEKGIELLISQREEIFSRKKQEDFELFYDVTLEEGRAVQRFISKL